MARRDSGSADLRDVGGAGGGGVGWGEGGGGGWMGLGGVRLGTVSMRMHAASGKRVDFEVLKAWR